MIGIHSLFCLNEQGRRENIEDSVFPACGHATIKDRLFLVCDGVGGESKGEEASRIAVEGFSDYLTRHTTGNVTENIQKAFEHTVEQMQLYTRSFPEAAKMSTTLTFAYLLGDKILVAWCGDSRIYHLRDGKVLWRSADHSLVGKLVEQGEITEAEAEKHPQKNIILRSVNANGKFSDVELKWLTAIEDGDYLFLCTDGVLEQINGSRLEEIVTNAKPDKKGMFLEYCDGNTSDNFSLYLLQLRNSKLSALKKRNFFIGVIGLLIVLIGVSAFLWYKKHNVLMGSQNGKDTVGGLKTAPGVPAKKPSDVVIPSVSPERKSDSEGKKSR